MDAIPTTAQTRGRGKSATPSAAAEPKASAKTARRRKPKEPVGAVEIGDRGQLIATTAYFLAAARGFEPGHELEDWLEAERRVSASG